jgi:two-component system nitrogen regulation sensor histidine kinase GlnL
MLTAATRIHVHNSGTSPATGWHDEMGRAVLDHMTTAVLLFDAGTTLVGMNPAAEELLDMSLNKISGVTLTGLFDHAEIYESAMRRVLASEQPITEREMSLGVPGVGSLTVDCVMTPIGRGSTLGEPAVLVELIPLDRHKQISREERLVADSESARQVLRGLAHEIRNPLGGLRGAAQLLERELTDEALREYTRVIVREADRLQNLMDRMLGPRTPPRMRALNIHEVTERVYALVSAEAPAGVRVEKDYDPSIPELDADPELLIQAVLNVARNAVEAVDGRGRVVLRTRIHRQFTIGHRHHGLVARIDVVDDGPGVPAALSERVFYPLVTGRADGSGLGLSIAQSLVNQHGGLIEYRSRSGSTTFSILLPVPARPEP